MKSVKPTKVVHALGLRLYYGIIFVMLFLLIGVVAMATARQLIIGDFSTKPQSGILPEGWKLLPFKNVETQTQYRHRFIDGRGVIEAESTNGASGLIHKSKIDPAQFPVITWEWKVSGIIQKGDISKKSGDDCPARVYISFAYDPSKVGFWEKVKFNAIKLFYGEYPPIGAISYIWANKAEIGQVKPSPYTDRVQMIVVESGTNKAGKWVEERRNIVTDYRRAFHEDPPAISGIGIMTDTDNTGGSVKAWYGNIIMGQE